MSNRKSALKDHQTITEGKASFFSCYWQDCLCVVVLFVGAWFIRFTYQSESITDNPFRADAGRYALTAFNLRLHGAYSLEKPSPEAPKTRTDLPPGYPLFLMCFLEKGAKGWAVDLPQVRQWQNVMGSVVVVLTYLLARQGLPLGWSFLAGVLACMSPHLIVISDYVLTESLFTILMVSGVWVMAMAWRWPSFWLIALGSFFMTLSSEVRYISLAMPFFFVPLFFFRSTEKGFSDRKSKVVAVLAILAGFFAVQALHGVFVKVAVKNSDEIEEFQKKSFKLKTPWGYLSKNAIPPNYYVDGGSHVNSGTAGKAWKARSEKSFSEAPLAYLRWNLYGRTLVFWHFDNVYNGDVYVYPMIRKGFVEHGLLKSMHSLMRLSHWPLYALAWGGLLLLAYLTWKGKLDVASHGLWVPALGFAYFLAVLTGISWLPRYSIPARPFSYVMVAFCLAWLVSWWQSRRELGKA